MSAPSGYVGVRCYKIWSPQTGHYTGWKFAPAYINAFNRMDIIDQMSEVHDIRTHLFAERGVNPRAAHIINDASFASWCTFIRRNPLNYRRRGRYEPFF